MQILQSKKNSESDDDDDDDDVLLTQVLNEHEEKLDSLSLKNINEKNFRQTLPPNKKVNVNFLIFIF